MCGATYTESKTYMSEYFKTNHTLPDAVVSGFVSLGDNLLARNLYSLALRDAGWTLQSIASATGVTRERVRQVTNNLVKNGTTAADARAQSEARQLLVPSPPAKPVKAKREFVEPDPVKLARMLELQPLAQQVRANSPQYREEAEEYTRLIAESHLEDGVTLYRLAIRLKLTHGALRFRLARYGYKLPVKGVSKVYTRIDPSNRVS